MRDPLMNPVQSCIRFGVILFVQFDSNVSAMRERRCCARTSAACKWIEQDVAR